MKRLGILQAALLATSSLVAAGAFSPAVAGGPTGARVVFGQATITRPKSNETLIDQTSNRALIDWTSFSIPSGSIVDFNQPGKSSLTVNRVTGPDTSQIDGELLANGAIWLLNANGIIFDRGSQINVGALLATTSDIDDSDLEDGRYAFSKHSANPNAAVVNQGTIRTTSGGSVVLSASHVSNQGMIEANLGTIVMGAASGFTVDMAGDNLIRYQITAPVTSAPKGADGGPVSALVSNSGTVSAAGGKVLMTAAAVKSVQDDVINNTGIVEATSVSSHDGEIDLDAGPNGTVDAGGTLDASGNAAGEKGGTIEIAGSAVHVENGATLDASGADGGGTVLVGGGFHGKGPIANAATTLVGNATIDVNATGRGNGGKVAVWSNKHTVFAGRIDASGGRQGGDGGYVETSSGVSLQVALDAVVNASAPEGTKGSWLLDPLNIIIETGGTTQLNHGVLGLNVDPGKTDTVAPATITDALETTNVLLEAANDITVVNDVIYGSTNSLIMLAEHDINVYANVQNTMANGGGVYLIAGWNGTTTNLSQLTNPGVYGNNGGSIFVGTTNAPGNVAVGSASGLTVAAGDNITVEADNGYAQIGYAGTGGGNIDVLATGNVTVDALNNPIAQIGNGGGSVVGNVAGAIDVDAAGSVTVEAPYNGDNQYTLAAIGNVAGSGSSSESGDISIIAPGGVDVSATGYVSNAFIGNGDYVSSTGGATGNITITTGALTIYADNDQQGLSEAFIGDGGQFRNGGTSGGAINITATSLDIEADASNTSDSQARIANRSTGDVIGDIDITTTGNITLFGNDEDGTSPALVRVGDVSAGCETPPCTGTVTGNVMIQSGDAIDMLTQNTGGVFVGNGGAVEGGTISLTASSDINLEETGSGADDAGIEIGTFDDNVGGGGANVSLTTTHGSITLEAEASDSSIFIGNSSNGYNFATSGNVSLYAPNGSIELSATGVGASISIGDNNLEGSAPVSGDITINAGDALDIGTNSLVGNEGTAGDISGSVTLTADSLSGFLPSFYNDIPNGNFTLDQTGTNAVQDSNVVDYSSPFTLAIITGGSLTFNGSLQNSGTGGIDITAGGDIVIGGPNATGNVSVGSRGGTTSVTADNLTVEADNGLAQLGYAGAGDGAIDVNTTGNVTVDALNNPYAQIGNGGYDISGTIGGNIDVNAGGIVTVESPFSDFVNFDEDLAAIGNTGGTNASESGDITIKAPGAIDVYSTGLYALSYIGNLTYGDTKGASTGNITLSTGVLNVESNNDEGANWAIVGDGQFNTDATNGGNIDITAGAVNVISDQSNDGSSEARIANRGNDGVVGNIDITTTGNIDIFAGAAPEGGTLSAIGLGEGCSPSCGTASGNITIDAGGAISVTSLPGGQARIADGAAQGNTVSVTAGGDITLDVNDGGQSGGEGGYAFIGNFGAASGGGGTVDVTSTGGDIILDASANSTTVTIGNTANGSNGAVGGNVNVAAPSGSIVLDASNTSTVQIGNSTDGGTGAVSGNIDVTAGDELEIEGGQQSIIGNTGNAGDISGSVTMTAQSISGFGSSFDNDIANGNFTLDQTSTQAVTDNAAIDYTSAYTLTVITGGNLTFDASLQNSGSGAIDIVTPGTVTIGGSGAKGNVAVGGAGGTSVHAADLILAADHGYAQLGFAGAGVGDIDVKTAGNVTLDGGAGAGEFAQIGNGGSKTSGSDGGDITITAGGDITLSGGAGALAYAQIGNGGAEFNQNSKGYSDTGNITTSAQKVALDAGSGSAAYAQIGNGGYEVGNGLTGHGTESGTVTVMVADSVALDGNGADAYAQIGNGGDQVDLNAASAASGGAIGDVTVTVKDSGGTATLAAGTGNDAYAQIGDGGYAENSPSGTAANFLTGGNVTVSATDVSLIGSDSGTDAYAQIGNGDASAAGIADIDGDVTVSGASTKTNGTASDAPALIGNATGTGTCSGVDCGGTQQQQQQQQQENDTESVLTQPDSTADTDILLAVFSPIESELPGPQTEILSDLAPAPLTPLEQMANASSNGDTDYEGDEPSDSLVASLGQSLDPAHGRKKSATIVVRTLIPGVLKQIVSTNSRNPRGVPPADEDYSSWGNEALWR